MSDSKNENDTRVMKSTQFLAQAVESTRAVKTGIDGIRRGLASANGIPADRRPSAQQMAATMKETGELMDMLTETGHLLRSLLDPIDPSLLN